MRRSLTLVAVGLALAGCALPNLTSSPDAPAGPVEVTPVRWKENTSFEQRRADFFECTYAAAGLPPTASEADLAQAQQGITEEQNIAFLDRCHQNKGYTLADKPVCSEAQASSGRFVIGSTLDALPPLSRVACISPSVGGFVVT